jgi:hypothetical protein
MSFFVYHRSGACETDPPLSIFALLLDELEERLDDEEHTSISVIHESEWGLSCYRDGYVTYEHVEGDGEPRNMRGLSRNRLIALMGTLAGGDLAALENEPWQAGY